MPLEIEQIAQLDLAIKTKHGKANLIHIDRLMVTVPDTESVNKLKTSALALNDFDVTKVLQDSALQDTWKTRLIEQIKFSVKQIKSNNKKT